MNHQPSIKSLPFYQELTYQELLYVNSLASRGASAAVVYLWYNITHGMYGTGVHVLENDKDYFKKHYPDFSEDIDQWKP